MKPKLRVFLPEYTGKSGDRFITEEWLEPLSNVYELDWTNQDPHIIPLVIPERFDRMLAIISKISASDNTGIRQLLNKRLRMQNFWVQLNSYIEKQIKYCKTTSFYRPVTVAIFKNTAETDMDSKVSGFNYCFFPPWAANRNRENQALASDCQRCDFKIRTIFQAELLP